MLKLTFLLAALADNPLDSSPIPDVQPSTLFGMSVRDLLLVVGVALVLGLSLFILVYLTHKRRRRHHSSHQLSRAIYRAEKKPADDAVSAKGVKVRKRRRRHPENLPRNPTLGETGGLPPIRPEEPPVEPAQQA